MKKSLAPICLILCSLLAGAFAQGQNQQLAIQNSELEIVFNISSSRFSLTHKPSKRTFVKDGRLSAEGGAAKITTVLHQTLGQGQVIEISHPGGGSDTITLYRNLPFAFCRASLHNGGGQTVVTNHIRTLSVGIDLGKPAAELKTLGTGGLLAPDKNPGSYVWLALADPQSRNGVAGGWLACERGSGIVFSKAQNGQVQLDAQLDYGRLLLGPGTTQELETFALGYFEDARLGLETWASTVATRYNIKLAPQPVGYCTWYSSPNGGASDEKHLAELAAFSATNLAPFGFSVVQIDDRWQAGVSTNGPKRNFSTHAPKGPYPTGMKAAADNLKSLGLTPGLWFMPFAGTYYDPFFKDHQDWFVKHDNGQPYETSWGGTSLDMTHPGARDYLRKNVQRIAREWGYRYFKMDGLWTGTATKQMYVNSGFKEDGIGEAVFHNREKSNIEAYRDGLKLVREAVGPDVFFLGCCTPQNMRSYGGAMGLVDAMRIGPDNGSGWSSLLRGPTFGTRHYFLHGRVWYNDPDPIYVRASMPLKHAQLICSWVTLSGQLNLSSEWLPGLPPERLDLLKRTMPSHGLLPRPADLFDEELPRVWLLTDERRSPRRDVIGLFNWGNSDLDLDYAFDRLGLSADAEYLLYDYWQNELLTPMKGRLRMKLPAQSCRVLAVRPRLDNPQLLSTSRHITQGIVDVLEEKWDNAGKLLSGRSKLVGGDIYELRVATGGFSGSAKTVELSADDKAAGVKATLKQAEGLVRATLESPANREVTWRINYE